MAYTQNVNSRRQKVAASPTKKFASLAVAVFVFTYRAHLLFTSAEIT